MASSRLIARGASRSAKTIFASDSKLITPYRRILPERENSKLSKKGTLNLDSRRSCGQRERERERERANSSQIHCVGNPTVHVTARKKLLREKSERDYLGR